MNPHPTALATPWVSAQAHLPLTIMKDPEQHEVLGATGREWCPCIGHLPSFIFTSSLPGEHMKAGDHGQA